MSNLEDPRVFFAAERTLLAWNRTSLTLMGFGFIIERFGLFLLLVLAQQGEDVGFERGVSYWVGLAFIAMGSIIAVASTVQYRLLLRALKPIEVPQRYAVNMGVIVNLFVAALGLGLIVYLFANPAS